MDYRNVRVADLRQQARLFEEGWKALCEERGETRYVEMFDRHRRCYGRVLIPSEVFFVWNQTEWISSNDSDNYGHWEPIVSQVVAR